MSTNPRHPCPSGCGTRTSRPGYCRACTHDLAYTGGWVRDGLIWRPVPTGTPESIRATLRGGVEEK